MNVYEVRHPIPGYPYVPGMRGLCIGVNQLFSALRSGWVLPIPERTSRGLETP